MEKRYSSWLVDSNRWDAFPKRANDIVVATYPKSGTTWMLRILSLLIFRSGEARPLDKVFPWWEYVAGRPLPAVLGDFEAQTHRRAVKSHLPFDGFPKFDDVKYIHVARDGRDVCLSYHNHCTGFRPEALANMDAIGLAEPSLRRPYPRPDADAGVQFHRWLTEAAIPGEPDGTPFLSYFAFEQTYWAARKRENLLFVHYDDLKADLTGEMRRIADFAQIEISAAEIAALVSAASFESMRKQADALIPDVAKNFQGGGERLVNKGESGRWRGLYAEADLALFDQKLHAAVPEEYARWLLEGRIRTGGRDPSLM